MYGDGEGVGWGGDVHVHVHVAFTSNCSNRRIYGDGEGWGGVGMFTFMCMKRSHQPAATAESMGIGRGGVFF